MGKFIADINKITTADNTANTSFVEVVGNKEDAASNTASTASIIALLRYALSELSTIGGAIGASGTITGTSDSGTGGTLVDATLTQADNYFNGMVLLMTSGNNAGLARTIVDFDAATDTISVEPDFDSVIGTDSYIILPRSEFTDILIGNNNNNNEADTSNVVANVDGSILERLEHIVVQLLTGGDIYDVLYTDAAGTNIAADIIALDAVADAILVDTGTTLPTILGTPVVDLATDIATVDTVVDTINTNVGDASLHTLTDVVSKLGDLPSDLATLIGVLVDLGGGADLANNFNDIAGATFDTTTDSNEAIRNQLDALIGSPVVDIATDILAIDTLIGTPAVDIATDVASIKTVVDNIYDTVDTEIASIKAETDQIGTIVNSGGTAELGALLGDFANTTLVARLNTIDDFLDTEVADILADTNELQGDWVNGGRLDLILDELTTQGDTNEGKLDTIDTVVDAIKLITDALPDSGALTSIAQESTLGTPVGVDLSTDIASIKTVADAIEVDTTSIESKVDTVDTNVDTILINTNSADSSSTFSYLDAGGEQDVFEITNSTRKIINSLWVDCINLTNNGTFKVYYKIDGTNYRELTDLAYTITAGTTEAVNLLAYAGGLGITEDIKVTYEEASDEGAAIDIPYSVVYETKE